MLSNANHTVPSNTVDNTTEQPNGQKSESSAATLTITSSAAVVETPTSKVMLPPLQPLTTKYASMPGLSSNSTENQVKGSTATVKSSSHTKDKVVSGTKHKHRENDESSTPAKKLKTMHSSSSHSSQSKHPSSSGRPPFQSKHGSHPTSKSSTHSAPGSHHKLLIKSGSSHSGQPHSPKVPVKSSSSHSTHAHHNSSPKLPGRSSSSHGNSSTHSHHSSSKRHSHPGHSTSSHTSGSKTATSHKHSGSPLDVKKSSGERHRRPSSSTTKPRPEMPVPSIARANDLDKVKKNQTSEDFVSPPGPQRLQKLPTTRPINTAEKSASHHGPPLPLSGQATPPLPPLPSNLPPPPPPPPT